jgi:Rad3-related DNA helicase
MPYNYLIDPKIRDNYKIDFSNSIIILDEAHNIEKVSEEVASFDLNLSLLQLILNELGSLANFIENG